MKRCLYFNKIPLTQGLKLKGFQGLVNHVHEEDVSKIMKGDGGLGDREGPTHQKGAGSPQKWLVVAMLEISLLLTEFPIF